MEPSLVIVGRFLSTGEAQAAKNALDAAGIDAFIADANLASIDWLMSNAIGGIKLLVRTDDVDAARELLSGSAPAIDSSVPADMFEVREHSRPLSCPECTSEEIRPARHLRIILFAIALILAARSYRFDEPTAALLSAVAIGVYAYLFPRLRCANCSKRFDPPPPDDDEAFAEAVRGIDPPADVPCPHCGSTDTRAVGIGRRLKATTLLMPQLGCVLIPVALLSKVLSVQWQCDSCRKTWRARLPASDR